MQKRGSTMRKRLFGAALTWIFLFSSFGGGSVNAMELMTDTDAIVTDDDFTSETGNYIEGGADEVFEDELNVYANYATISSDEAYDKMIAMQAEYPTGTTWTNDNSYKWNCGWAAWGCMGFAHMISDAAFGNAGLRTVYDDGTGAMIDNIRVGDVLRLENDNHSVIVLQIYDDFVVIAEGNVGGGTVRWGRTISKEDMKNQCQTYYAQTGNRLYFETRYAEDTVTMTCAPDDGSWWWENSYERSIFVSEDEDVVNRFSATTTPANPEATIKWTSSNPSVVEIADDGALTVVDHGKSVITATYVEKGITSSFEVNVILPYSTPTGIFFLQNDYTGYKAGITTTEVSPKSKVEYSWYAIREYEESEECISDWKYGNEWLDWVPEKYGNYTLIGRTRVNGNDETIEEVKTDISYSPHIKGKCQMPYTGEGGGYLIGFETYDNPGQKYRYEVLILDCTLLAQGKDAWIYTTTQCGVADGNAFWTIWQPKYGYYWTLFRLFDENGNLIDEQCYGFQNI